MRNDTDQKRAPIICAVVIIVLLLSYIAAILFAGISDAMGDIAAWIAIGIFAVILLAIVFGVLLALHQRLKEIDNGEEEEARKY